MPTVRVTDAHLQIASSDESELRVTQSFVQVASSDESTIYVTQAFLQICSDGDLDTPLPTTAAARRIVMVIT